MAAYRTALGHNVARASVPYGYTAMNVAGAGALIDTTTYFLVAGAAGVLARGRA